MKIEYEATFYPIEKEAVRARLTDAGASRAYPERLMRRVTFHMPEGGRATHTWARVRDEGDRVTMSVKEMPGGGMEAQKESMVVIDSFDAGIELLRALGCAEKAYQETKRELWILDAAEVTIDEWPFLDPFIEVEGRDEAHVRRIAARLGFDWSEAKFYPAGEIYAEKYGVSSDTVNDRTPRLTFSEPNPFL